MRIPSAIAHELIEASEFLIRLQFARSQTVVDISPKLIACGLVFSPPPLIIILLSASVGENVAVNSG